MTTPTTHLDLLTQKLENELVVEANAGTGKTYSVTAMIVREIAFSAADSRPTEVDDFIVVTFTKNAAGDLRARTREQFSRVQRLLSGEELGDPKPFEEGLHAALDDNRVAALRAIDRALGALDRATITTIHQFCGSILRLAGFHVSEILEDRALEQIIREVASDLVVQRSQDGTTSRSVDLDRLQRLLSKKIGNPDIALDNFTLTTSDDDADLEAALTHLVEEGEKRVRDRLQGKLTHDETIRQSYDLLRKSELGDRLLLEQVRSMYRYCVIDEAQDTDSLQWKLFRLLFPKATKDSRALMIVGDPKQSIYAFRGADVGAFLEETAATPPRLMRDLVVNYRSDADLISALNVLFGGAEFGKIPGVRSIDYRTVKSSSASSRSTRIMRNGSPTEPIEMIGVDDVTNQNDVVPAVVDQIQSLLTGGYKIEVSKDGKSTSRDIKPADIAVLVCTGTLGRLIQRRLVEAGVPAVSNSTETVAHGDAFTALKRLAAAFQRPSDDGRTRSVAMSALLAVPGKDPILLDESFVTKLQQKFELWRTRLEKDGVGSLATGILGDSEVQTAFLATRYGLRNLTDFNHIFEFVETLTAGRPISALQFREALAEMALADHTSIDLAARRVESDDDAVQIASIHSAKGLEYPIVVLVDLWKPWDAGKLRGDPGVVRRDGAVLTPSGRAMDVGYLVGEKIRLTGSQKEKKALPKLDSAFKQLKSDADAETKRLVYVGATRAKHHLSVVYPHKIEKEITTLVLRDSGDGESPGCLDLNAGRLATGLIKCVTRAVDVPATGRGGTFITPPLQSDELKVAVSVRTAQTIRDRTSFSEVKERIEKPSFVTDSRFALDDIVKADDEFASAAPLPEDDDSNAVPVFSMPLWALPRGADFGNELHTAFEYLNPSAPDMQAEVARVIDIYMSPALRAKHRDSLISGILKVMETPLGPVFADIRLRDIPTSDRLTEARFETMLPEGPIVSAPTTNQIGAYIASSVAPLDPMRAYGEILSRSTAGVALRGTLNGSLDALLRLPNSGLIVTDYKSNYVRDPSGVSPRERYSPENLWPVMMTNHYPLQALIYGLATYRYLLSRGATIETADAQVLGFAYFFVRGMTGTDTLVQAGSSIEHFNGGRYGVSSWTATAYPGFWSGLSRLLGGRA